MSNMKKFLKLFLYAGLEKEEYHQLLPDIREENRQLLYVFSQIGAIMFLLLFIASMLSHGFATTNSTTYLISGVLMIVILFSTVLYLPKYPMLIMPFVYLFEIVLYSFGIRISLLHADKAAVSAIAFLLVSPLLFYDRPVRLSALIAAVVAVFCALVVHFKTPEVWESDVWNMITFGIVAVAATVFTMSIKMRALSQSRQIEYMSQTDLLTGTKNRNHYENRLPHYTEICDSNLICVYADVNGLHEMNNRDGHPAGDRMLREAAKAMQQHFGEEDTYRVGGDEFIAFRANSDPENLPSEIESLKEDLRKKGYNVSFGFAVGEKEDGHLDMFHLVSTAESNMFADKRDFYRRSENDRRSR